MPWLRINVHHLKKYLISRSSQKCTNQCTSYNEKELWLATSSTSPQSKAWHSIFWQDNGKSPWIVFQIGHKCHRSTARRVQPRNRSSRCDATAAAAASFAPASRRRASTSAARGRLRNQNPENFKMQIKLDTHYGRWPFEQLDLHFIVCLQSSAPVVDVVKLFWRISRFPQN